MKRALAGVLAIALVSLMAAGATAQVPFFQVYFDDASNGSYGETQASCGELGVKTDLYLVCQNWNMLVIGVEYQVYFPEALAYADDTYPTVMGGTLVLGNSYQGAAVGYGLPRNGFFPMLISTIGVYWTGLCDCAVGPQRILVAKHPGSDANSPTGVRFEDYAIIPAVGMTSLICPGEVATEETTWGGIKALYR
jgi:hypothetical protein